MNTLPLSTRDRDLPANPAELISDDDIDYGQLLPVKGHDGAYLIEYEPLEDTEDGIKRSLEYLRRVLPGATLDG